MSEEGSITLWIDQLKAGDHGAAQKLWERYYKRLIGLARRRLEGSPRRLADEEDLALCAFGSFCRAAEEGRFPRLNDRNDLWQLLVMLTARKAIDLIRKEGRDRAVAETNFEQVIGPEPTPEFAAQVAEAYERLLARLGDVELRTIALAKMEGCTDEEIAARVGRAPRTVRRRLRLIRDLWAKEVVR